MRRGLAILAGYINDSIDLTLILLSLGFDSNAHCRELVLFGGTGYLAFRPND